MWQRVFRGASELLTSPNKGETAVHCCDPAVSVLVMLVSLAVLFVFTFFQLIRSLVDPTLAALIVYRPSQYLVSHCLKQQAA